LSSPVFRRLLVVRHPPVACRRRYSLITVLTRKAPGSQKLRKNQGAAKKARNCGKSQELRKKPGTAEKSRSCEKNKELRKIKASF
jgi:hypothetical protein